MLLFGKLINVDRCRVIQQLKASRVDSVGKPMRIQQHKSDPVL